jgi:hypothetical protein
MAVLGNVNVAKKARRTGKTRIGIGLRFMCVAPGEFYLVVPIVNEQVIGKEEDSGTHRFALSLPREFAARRLPDSQQERVEVLEGITKLRFSKVF